MFILKSKEQLGKAVAKAQKVKPIIRMIAFGVYAVKGSAQTYTVKMERKGDEKRIICECKASERGLICYHGAAALELHGTLAKHRQTALA